MNRIRSVLSSLIAVLVLAALPAGAQASTTCLAAPGQGAIDQYCELVPSGGGDHPAGTKTQSKGNAPAATVRVLRGAGADGAAVVALTQTQTQTQTPAARTRPRTTTRKATRKAPTRTAAAKPLTAREESALATPAPVSAVSAVRISAVGGPSTGSWLPWVMLAMAAGAVAITVARRRTDA